MKQELQLVLIYILNVLVLIYILNVATIPELNNIPLEVLTLKEHRILKLNIPINNVNI